MNLRKDRLGVYRINPQGAKAQKNADEIESILFSKEFKIWNAVVAKRQTLGGLAPSDS